MAETLSDFDIPEDTFVSLNNLSGILVGTSFRMQNKGTNSILLIESNTQPADDSQDGVILTTVAFSYASAIVATGSGEIWAKADNGESKITLQEV